MIQKHRKHVRHWWLAITGVVIIAASTVSVLRLSEPLPPLTLKAGDTLRVSAKSVTLPWPASNEAAIGLADGTILSEASAAKKVVPIASIAKLVTILTVLQKYPLKAGEQGPTLTLTN